MAGQSAQMTRKEVIAHSKAVDCTPGGKTGGSGGGKKPEMKKK